MASFVLFFSPSSPLFFLLEYSCFAMLYWFLLCNEMTQLYVHISPLPRGPLSHPSQFSSVQSLSHVQLFATPWTAACQASLSIANSQNLLKLVSIESVMPSNNLILCHPLLLLPHSFPASGSFPMSQFFPSGGESIGVSASASVLPMNIQD